jgi:hypothetical protein
LLSTMQFPGQNNKSLKINVLELSMGNLVANCKNSRQNVGRMRAKDQDAAPSACGGATPIPDQR